MARRFKLDLEPPIPYMSRWEYWGCLASLLICVLLLLSVVGVAIVAIIRVLT